MDALSLAYAANLALGLFLLALGACAAGLPPRGLARGLLGAYLALVGINYACDGLVFLLGAKGAGSPLERVASSAAAFDPPTLLLFALASGGARLAPAGVVAAYFPSLLVAQLLPLALSPPLHAALHAVLTLACYLGAFALLLRRYLEARAPEERDASGVLVVAFGVICLTRVPLALVDLGIIPGGPAGRASLRSLPLEAALVAAFLAFALLLHARAGPSARPHARRTILATGALLAVLDVAWLLRFVPHVRDVSFALMYSARWLIFLGVLTEGLRRHALLGLPAGVAPGLRRTYAALLAVVGAGSAAALLRTIPGTSEVVALLGGSALAGLVAGAVVAVRLAAPRSPDETEWRRAAAYRAHVELGASSRELDGLRRSLGLSRAQARALEEVSRVERDLPARTLPDRVEPGRTLLGRYEVERVVGVGAFGRTYAATDAVTGERVVLKELLPAWRDDSEALARFRREAETALRIRHPALVEMRGLERLAEGHVLVLGHVEGETLAARLARGKLGEAEAARLAGDLLAGLAHLHRHGILHRDVKPENVMLRPGGGAVLLDLGAVTSPGGGTRALGAHPGTPGYASPEQERGEPLTPASDVYSAGVLLRRALSGRPPGEGHVPDAWRAPLEKATAPRPEDRWADAGAFLEALAPANAARA